MKDDEYRAAKETLKQLRADWNKYIRDYLGLRLDRAQRAIVESVQENRRTSVRSGHARGKDFTAAAISVTFLNLYYPSKVINTAPTERQAIHIMMAEISRIYRVANKKPGGEVQSNMIKMFDFPSRNPLKDWFLLAFKAADKRTEDWTGFHSPNILIVVTEASGIEQETFNSMEGCLTGRVSRLLLVFNPNRAVGEAYQSTRSPQYAKHRLSCLRAPNVRAKKILIPGQVDFDWVAEKVKKPGWCTEIDPRQADPVAFRDFKFDGHWYRPSDLFLVKVLGEFPRESDDVLYPMSWLEAGVQRWHDRLGQDEGPLRIGADIAGFGTDKTVFGMRRNRTLTEFKVYAKSDHMATVGKLKIAMEGDDRNRSFIDTIGEGAGVYSRGKELGMNVVSAKFSFSANGRTDLTNQRQFVNMRAYCYWALRDALDPKLGGDFAIPPDDELIEEMSTMTFETKSDGKIQIEPKEDIKERLGRSPDKADAAALTFWPTSTTFAFVSSGAR